MNASRSTAWRAAAPALAAAAIALLVAAPSLANGFAYDDLPIIVNNPRVTEPHSLWWHLHQGYWPSLLYRPLTIWFFSLQWRAGDGSPWTFHAINALLLAANTVLVFRLARAWLPPVIACAAASLFAVHPVHVEAVANVVGQSELLATLGVLAAVVLFVGAVPGGPRAARRLAIAIATLAACLAKENGFVAPLLLAVAGATVSPERPWHARWQALAPSFLLASIMGASALGLRAAVLGFGAGDEPALVLRGLSPWQRALTMLGLVPEGLRLLLWPAHLQTEYGPPQYSAATGIGAAQLVGMALILGLLWCAWRCRSGQPSITFGIAWAAAALLPVSNLVVPSGVLLAERTLYLPSVGATIAVAGLAGAASAHVRLRPLRWLLFAGLGAIVVAGAARSVQRAGIWRSNEAVFTQGVSDAPRSYRAWRMLGIHFHGAQRWEAAEVALRRSLTLWDRDPSVYEALGLTLVQLDACDKAIPVLERGIAVDSSRVFARARLFFCQTKLERWVDARRTGLAGIAAGDSSYGPHLKRVDSALAARRTRETEGQNPPSTGQVKHRR